MADRVGMMVAGRLVMAGVDLRTVAELLGHRTLQMVMRYAHLAPEHQASAVDRLVPGGGRIVTKSAIEEFGENIPKHTQIEIHRRKEVKTRRGGRARLNAPDLQMRSPGHSAERGCSGCA